MGSYYIFFGYYFVYFVIYDIECDFWELEVFVERFK